MIDIADRLTATHREVRATDTDEFGLVLRRRFPAPPETVWGALTEVDRLTRWFGPVTGDLRPGGTVELAGPGTATVLDCAAPHLFAVTWGSDTVVVTVRLAADDQGDTVLELVHTGVGRDGAVRHGPDWDVAVAALERFLAGDVEPDPAAWRASTEVQTFAQHSASAWVRASEVSGVATADQLVDAVRDCLRRLAPDLTGPSA
ncbi:SRPBCC domain-containing protein [Saccharomonospora sp. NB11]|jgi:uncharacterized protein YndB with AHSA1/START domain|uniref:SRPBCC domain-containing protein n=1 Tax=Saccharomonospora sp. NB11 TaxID=1642298 RepID=UPI0018D03227|nr:SRPBCC domain-containing protein [Saccharomonospora sp. NB11]